MILGVTGSIGAGKTTVAMLFKKLGAYVIDADKIVHQLLDEPTRKRLGSFIFEDDMALKKLCTLLHPIVKKIILLKAQKNISEKIIVIDAPLLIESSLHKKCDYVVVVKSPYKKQLERARKNLSISVYQIRKRLQLQMSLREKLAVADFVIDNSGSFKNTEKQVKEVWKKIQPAKGVKGNRLPFKKRINSCL